MSLNSVNISSRLSGSSKNPFPLQYLPEFGQFGLRRGFFNSPCPFSKTPQFFDLSADLVGVAGQSHGLKHTLQALPVVVLQLLKVIPVREVRRRGTCEVLGLLEARLKAR